jgi:hypothetical protein
MPQNKDKLISVKFMKMVLKIYNYFGRCFNHISNKKPACCIFTVLHHLSSAKGCSLVLFFTPYIQKKT